MARDLASDRYLTVDCGRVRNKITTFARTAATFPDDPHPNEIVFTTRDVTKITNLLQQNSRNAVVLRQFGYQLLNLAIGQLADGKLASIGELRRAGNVTSAGLPSSFAMVGAMEVGLPRWDDAVTGRAFMERNRAGDANCIAVCKDNVFLKALLRAMKRKPEDGPPATPGYADRLVGEWLHGRILVDAHDDPRECLKHITHPNPPREFSAFFNSLGNDMASECWNMVRKAVGPAIERVVRTIATTDANFTAVQLPNRERLIRRTIAFLNPRHIMLLPLDRDHPMFQTESQFARRVWIAMLRPIYRLLRYILHGHPGVAAAGFADPPGVARFNTLGKIYADVRYFSWSKVLEKGRDLADRAYVFLRWASRRHRISCIEEDPEAEEESDDGRNNRPKRRYKPIKLCPVPTHGRSNFVRYTYEVFYTLIVAPAQLEELGQNTQDGDRVVRRAGIEPEAFWIRDPVS